MHFIFVPYPKSIYAIRIAAKVDLVVEEMFNYCIHKFQMFVRYGEDNYPSNIVIKSIEYTIFKIMVTLIYQLSAIGLKNSNEMKENQ